MSSAGAVAESETRPLGPTSRASRLRARLWVIYDGVAKAPFTIRLFAGAQAPTAKPIDLTMPDAFAKVTVDFTALVPQPDADWSVTFVAHTGTGVLAEETLTHRSVGSEDDDGVLYTVTFAFFDTKRVIEGRLVRADGRPIAGAAVALWSNEPGTPPEDLDSRETRDDGRFVLKTKKETALLAGVAYDGPGAASIVPLGFSIGAGDRHVDLGDIIATEGSTIGGTVSAGSDRGIACRLTISNADLRPTEAEAKFQLGDRTLIRRGDRFETLELIDQSDDGGHFAVGGLDRGPWRVECAMNEWNRNIAVHADLLTDISRTVVAPDSHVDFFLQGAEIRFHGVAEETGESVPFRLDLVDATNFSCTPSEDGNLRILAPIHTAYTFFALSPASPRGVSGVVLTRGVEGAVDVTLRFPAKERSVTLVLVPSPGTLADVSSLSINLVGGQDIAAAWFMQTVAERDDSGRFVAEHVPFPVGRHRFQVFCIPNRGIDELSDYWVAPIVGLDIPLDGVVTEKIDIRRGGRVSIDVLLDADWEALSVTLDGEKVQRFSDPPFPLGVRAATFSGVAEFATPPLLPGRRTLVIRDAGNIVYTEVIKVKVGETTKVSWKYR